MRCSAHSLFSIPLQGNLSQHAQWYVGWTTLSSSINHQHGYFLTASLYLFEHFNNAIFGVDQTVLWISCLTMQLRKTDVRHGGLSPADHVWICCQALLMQRVSVLAAEGSAGYYVSDTVSDSCGIMVDANNYLKSSSWFRITFNELWKNKLLYLFYLHLPLEFWGYLLG